VPAVPSDTYLSLFATAARNAEQAENIFRKGYATELERLERERAFAHRRHGLMQAIGVALSEEGEDGTVQRAVRRVLAQEFGLEAEREAHQPILEAFDAVSAAITASIRPADDAPEPDPSTVQVALAAFEEWYFARTGTPFMALYDVYVQETPVVDW
jgi:hypothetical protein